jgi:hypothetical protein
MRNHNILVTLGAAVAALFASLGDQVQANVPHAQDVSKQTALNKTGLDSRDVVLQRIMYQMGQDNHSLTLHRSEGGILYAGHGSHASHRSHASHGSHRSGR